jgi:putative transposase
MEPEYEGDLGRFMHSIGRRYVRYINDTYERTGTLWEGRLKSAVVSRDEYLILCSQHI